MKEERNSIPVTALIMIRRGNEVLLMKRFNTGYEDGKYCFPGGHVEKGEEIKKAAIREAKEEIGIDIEEDKVNVIHVFNRKVKDNAYIDFILECHEWKGNIRIMEKDKADEIKWFDIDNMPNNVIPFMKEVFKDNSGFYIPFGWDESDV